MKKNPSFAVFYMFGMTAICSVLLISLARGTDQRVETNRKLEFEKAVLRVFPEIQYDSDAQAHQIFVEHFEESAQAGDAYIYRKDGQIAGYVVPISGKGFWATISGIVGVKADGKTVTGISFYEQSETPGLGARITEPEFKRQFVDLKMQNPPRPIDFRPPGQTLAVGQVHAISGATQTCVRVEKFLNEDLSNWMQSMSKAEAKP